MTTLPVLSRTVSVAEPPGSEIVIEPSAEERDAMAQAYSLLSVPSFLAHVSVAAHPPGALRVEGRVQADIVQSCVVTLEPVHQHIDEAFSLRFVRESGRAPRPGQEVFVDVGAGDPPEVITGGTIDIGAIVEEHFALAIDPYPRAAGADLPPEASDGDNAGESPFAPLAGLSGPAGKKR